METVRKILFFTVGIILTVSFVAIGITMFNKSKVTIGNTANEYDTLIGRFDNIEYALYENGNSSASGSEVRDLIGRLSEESVTIYVKNGAFKKSRNSEEDGVAFNCGAGKACGYGEDCNFVAFEEALKNIKDRGKAMFYINPNALFSAEVRRDSNGNINELVFEQK